MTWYQLRFTPINPLHNIVKVTLVADHRPLGVQILSQRLIGDLYMQELCVNLDPNLDRFCYCGHVTEYHEIDPCTRCSCRKFRNA